MVSKMNAERGNLSIHSENIFPIIKKWLYSDHDIFMRELISNGCDAITKLKKLEMVGEAVIPEGTDFKVTVSVNQEEKTIKITDNGVGMTMDEVKQYINQIAFSGAEAFLEKYKDKANSDQIIGHFGLGFYSAFMVAHKVTIDTLSWQEGAEAVHWESEEGINFEMSASGRTERGTEITLYLNEDSYEFSNEYRAKEVIEKYCSFMPIAIYFVNENAPQPEKTAEQIADEAMEAAGTADEAAKKDAPKPMNETQPLWAKHPNECTEEEYKDFYRKVFRDYKEPLFWIHLNMDYPFRMKGILYFPKVNTEYDNLEGTIKLYCNQVFIADNIKEVIPEFLLLLKGTIDCPDLPLNVSRSALQNDGFVKKISEYITKKVADKLSGMYKVERESYEKFWDDIAPFIKYGCLKDDKFRDKMKDFMLFKDLDDKYMTLNEYLEAEKAKKNGAAEEADNADAGENTAEESNAEATDKADDAERVSGEVVDENGDVVSDAEDSEEDTEEKKDTIYYVTDLKQQSQYVNMFKDAGMNAVILTHNIDQPFISQLEQFNDKIRFMRIDAGLNESMKEDVDKADAKELKKQQEKIADIIKKALGKEKLDVKLERLKNDKVSSMMTLSEESRRMQDMMKMYNMAGMGMDDDLFGGGETLVLNANHPLVQYVMEHRKGDMVKMICEQLYDLALLGHKPLNAEAMTRFVERSNEIMLKLTK